MSAIVNNGQNYGSTRDVDEDEIDFRELIGVLLDYKWTIAAITAATIAMVAIYIFVATPVFRADGLIQVEEKTSGLGSMDIAELFEGDTSVNAEIEILRSRLVLGTVVDNLKLDIVNTPEYFPLFGAAVARRSDKNARVSIRVDTLDVPASLVGQRLRLTADAGDRYTVYGPDSAVIVDGRVGESADAQVTDGEMSIFVSELRAEMGDSFRIQRLSRLRAIDSLKKRLSINEKGKSSGILAVSLEDTSPEGASRTLNEIANVYVRKNVERKSAEAQKTLEFLEEHLPIVKQDMEVAEVALNTYRLEKGSIDLPLETQGILETIVTVESQLNELQRERERVTQSFTPAHPMVIALDRQIGRLNSELLSLNDQVRELPSTQQEVLRLVRDTQVNTELYTSLLNTAQELRVVKAGTVGNVRVVDFSVPPYEPVKPKKIVLLVSAFFGGLFCAVFIVLIRRVLHGGIEDPEIIEKHCGIPVYATVAHSKRQDTLVRKLKSKSRDSAVLAIDSPDDIAIESLRNLQTALHFGMMGAQNNCIMIAGPSPGIGKSFISVNLAAVLTSAGKKVLLIDGDLRRGRLHQFLGIRRENGLSDFVSGKIPIGDAVHQTSIPNLSLIPSGQLPPNPSELLLHQRFMNCVSVLSSRYDHIVIDSPPVLAVADARIIGKMAGISLMVLKAGAHPMREIELSVKRLEQAGVNLRGILINDIDMQSRRYGTGKYVYQYSYGD